jgi:exosome complex component CSL4
MSTTNNNTTSQQIINIVTPGTLLVSTNNHLQAGRGTYFDNKTKQIRASVCGIATKQQQIHQTESSIITEQWIVNQSNNVVKSTIIMPFLGCEILGKVLRVGPKLVEVQILCVNEQPVHGGSFKGILRKENVRAFEVDLVDLYECFKTGDIVCCEVCALGGARSYELSTAQNHLGVCYAISSLTNEPMIPIDWTTMRDPTIESHTEKRKVASRTADWKIV